LSAPEIPATLDTNVVIYALLEGRRAAAAVEALRRCAFLSVQVLNEYANVAVRKHLKPWAEVVRDVADLRETVPLILPVDAAANAEALRIAERYRLSFYDALMLAVALAGGARTFYSEDMQHDLVIDGTLRILDPFR
jgi:predicted nucleic acid-binding protein